MAVSPLLIAGLVGAGLGVGGSMLFGGGKSGTTAPTAPAQPSAPTPQKTAKQAQMDADRRRRASILGGGKTSISRPYGEVSEANLGRKTLVGQ